MSEKNDIIEQLAMIDRLIISKRDCLERGEIISVKVKDGYIVIKNELDQETGKQKTVTFFSEFDTELNISMKEIIKRGSVSDAEQ